VTEAGRVTELKQELQAAREYLQATIEELEAANEELKSTNEEMQSANEELESSREELQSLNEELVTLNSEHEQKIARLTQVNNDLTNVLTRIDVGIIFLDSRLRMRRFNPAATRISNLIEGDVGRPIGHIVSNLQYEQLVQEAQLSRAQATAQVARDLAENIVNMSRDPLLVLAGDLRVISANLAFYAAFQATPEETVGQLIYELGQSQWDNPQLRELLAEIIPQRTSLEKFELEFDFPAVGSKQLRFNARQIESAGGQPPLILLVIEELPGGNKI